MHKPSLFLLPFLLLIFLSANAVCLVNDREITINSSDDIAHKRNSLISYIWGSKGFPTSKLPFPIIKNDISPLEELPYLSRVDTLTVEVDRGVKSYAHHFIPTSPNGRVVILHQGHFLSFDDSPVPADISFGMRRTIEGLLGDGYSVLAVYMPKFAQFQTSITVNDENGELIHNDFFTEEYYMPSWGTPMRYFLEPVAAYVNYLESRGQTDGFPKYSDINMVGFSGGGWTSTVYAAVDPRIMLSISIAGSLPLYLRPEMTPGDTEQTLDDFYSIAGYLDLYVMASYGPGRRQIQIYNRHDWCCFGEQQHLPENVDGMPWDEALRKFESDVRERLIKLGNTELFRLDIDEAAPGHLVSWDAIYDRILPELNEGHRDISSSGIDAAAKSASGNPMFFYRTGWQPGKLPKMIGMPAILTGALHINDMFFRNERNELAYVSRPPVIWSRAQVLDNQLISDPVAVSRSPETLDVIAFRSDYYATHYHFNGTEWTSEKVSDWVKGIGQATLMASPGNRLDLFYRSWNRQLYHAFKIGNEPWQINSAGGRMVDFPTAIRMNDGSFRAYVRGLNGGLWESILPADGGKWSGWTMIPVPDESIKLVGSPSAALRGGTKPEVSLRTSTGRLVTFTFNGSGWEVVDRGGSFTGSPTATASGTYARGPNGDLRFYNGTYWMSYGGSLD